MAFREILLGYVLPIGFIVAGADNVLRGHGKRARILGAASIVAGAVLLLTGWLAR